MCHHCRHLRCPRVHEQCPESDRSQTELRVWARAQRGTRRVCGSRSPHASSVLRRLALGNSHTSAAQPPSLFMTQLRSGPREDGQHTVGGRCAGPAGVSELRQSPGGSEESGPTLQICCDMGCRLGVWGTPLRAGTRLGQGGRLSSQTASSRQTDRCARDESGERAWRSPGLQSHLALALAALWSPDPRMLLPGLLMALAPWAIRPIWNWPISSCL